MRPGPILAFLLSVAPLAPAAAQSSPAPATAPDPAKIAAAERLVAEIMPPDLMRRMLGLPLPGMDAVLDMTPDQLGMGPELGFSAADRTRPVRELVSARDPHFRERLEIRSRVMNEVFGEILTSVLPEMTHYMVEFYAGQLTLEELNAAADFYATPAGQRFVRIAGNVTSDPAFPRLMTQIAPRFTAAMGTIEERVRAASAHLPPEPPRSTGASGHRN